MKVKLMIEDKKQGYLESGVGRTYLDLPMVEDKKKAKCPEVETTDKKINEEKEQVLSKLWSLLELKCYPIGFHANTRQSKFIYNARYNAFQTISQELIGKTWEGEIQT